MAGFGGHVKFIELTGQETVLRDTITRITAERDGFSAKLAGALKENAEIRRLNPMIEQFGPDVSEFHVFDIARDSGGALQIGRCPSEHCLTVHVDGPSRR